MRPNALKLKRLGHSRRDAGSASRWVLAMLKGWVEASLRNSAVRVCRYLRMVSQGCLQFFLQFSVVPHG